MSYARRTVCTLVSLACVLATACDNKADKQPTPKPTPEPTTNTDPEAAATPTSAGALSDTAAAVVVAIRDLESTRDVTCWTSFRQLDSFISSKAYSDFATITKIAAAKALVHAVWGEASRKSDASVLSVADIEAVFSIEAELEAAKKAELEKFAEDQGWQQFRDYRTTSEHWRVLLSVVQDELARTNPTLKPLESEALQHLALVTTRLGLSLLTESGQIAIEARTPLIESAHVQAAYKNLLTRHSIPESKPLGAVDHAAGNKTRIPLTGALIAAKVEALRSYNGAGENLQAELNKVSKLPLDEAATERMAQELRSMARFFARGYEPMRADNHLADGNFAPASLAVKPYVTAADIENTTQQIWPYLMMPNGDVKMRFEPRPGNISARDLKGQDVLLLDHQMNAVRDTALHWVILQLEWDAQGFAMDPFAAEYLSELISIVATFYLRRAQTLARAEDATTITAEHIARVRDVGYVATMPAHEGETSSWGPEQEAAKTKALAGITAPMFSDVTAAWGLPASLEPEAYAAQAPGDTTFDIQAVMGAGSAVADVDGDGFVDVFVAGQGLNRLLRNQGAKGAKGGKRFADVTAANMPTAFATPMDDVRGVLFVDIDADADPDLVVLRSRHASMLLRNNAGVFEELPGNHGFSPGLGAHAITALDYDADGDLDLYVGYYGSRACNDGTCTGRNLPSLDGRNGTPNELYRNDGGSFTAVGAATGTDDAGWTLSASSFDYDQDGSPDLYLANDFGANPLLRNKGDGTFEDVAVALGAADRGSGMNVSFADVDDNGRFDIFVSNIDMFSKNIKVVFPTDDSEIALSDQILRSFEYLSGNKLYLNVAQAEVGADVKVRFEPKEHQMFEPGDKGWGWAGIFFDADLDGDEDVYLANGWIPGSPAADQANLLYVRDAETYYQAPAGDQGFTGNSRSVVAADFDNDGDLDLLVNNYAAGPRLLRNETAAGPTARWMMLRPADVGGQSTVGAIVTVQAGDRTMRRLVTAGEGYLGQQEPRLHFGLGPAAKADVKVTWPSGETQSFGALEAGAVHELVRKPGRK